MVDNTAALSRIAEAEFMCADLSENPGRLAWGIFLHYMRAVAIPSSRETS